MKISIAQIFQIGSVLITLTAVLAGLKLDPQTTSVVSAAVLTAWNAIGAILTSPAQQIQNVASHIEDPSIKSVLVPAVANLPGINPLQINANADHVLKTLAASDEAINAKIEQLPTGSKPP